MKKILYATDFSDNAEKAFVHALKLAKFHNAELLMLHVTDIPTLWYPDSEESIDLGNQAIEEAETRLKQLFDQYANPNDFTVRYLAAENTVISNGILAAAEENEADLIIVGIRGNRVHDFLVGNTTKSLIKYSARPILAIPEKAQDKDYNKILYATDFLEEDIPAIQYVIDTFYPFSPQIIVAHVITPMEDKVDEKMDWFKQLVNENIIYNKIHFELLVADNIHKKLTSYATDNKVDLLVMLEKERKGIIDKFFHADLVTKMEFHTTVPIMSFNAPHLDMLSKTDLEVSGEER